MEDKNISEEQLKYKEEAAQTSETKEEKEKKEETTQKDGAALDEMQKTKLFCSLAYIFGILFFLPIVFYPNSSFAKFHANQALVILILAIVGEVLFGVLTIIPVVGFVFKILCIVFGALIILACIFGILGVVKEETKELPLIGKIKLIK